MIDPGVLYDKLASMESADEIAGLLSDYKVKALRTSATSCAISKFYNMHGYRVSTGTHRTTIFSDDGFREDIKLHTSAMRQFITNFDDGNYPFLEG